MTNIEKAKELINTFATGDSKKAESLLAEGYIQHNLAYGTGRDAFVGSVQYNSTYDNEETIRKMVEDQGFIIEDDGSLSFPETGVRMEVSSELIPYCPKCGKPMEVNLRCDDTFVEDEGWHDASGRYGDFLAKHGIKAQGFFTNDTKEKVDKNYGGKILLLELGIGMNTPGIIKYPFWQYTSQNKNVTYSCINMGEAYAPDDIDERSICIDGDIAKIFVDLKKE